MNFAHDTCIHPIEKPKRVLIMVISCQQPPYGRMINTSLKTWDSEQVDGVETIFYCGEPVQENSEKIIYFPIDESLHTMGHKDILAYEWALKNKDFDYVARVNSSCYVNKRILLKHCQGLPSSKVFAGLEVTDTPKWIWGGGQFIISRDVLQGMVDNKDKWNHSVMEDRAMSYLVTEMGIEYTRGVAASISVGDNGNSVICYNANEGFDFTDWNDLRKLDAQFFYRIKQDGQRNIERGIMEQMAIHLIE
jgi:hypothetical protein